MAHLSYKTLIEADGKNAPVKQHTSNTQATHNYKQPIITSNP